MSACHPSHRHSREGGNPWTLILEPQTSMDDQPFGLLKTASRLRGDDGRHSQALEQQARYQ